MGSVDIAKVEVGFVVITWCQEYILCRLTSTTAEYHTGGHAVVHTIGITYYTGSNLYIGVTAVEEVPCEVSFLIACPLFYFEFLAVTCRVVVVSTAGVVTLTNRGTVTTTIDVTQYATAADSDAAVAIDLTSRPTEDRFCFSLPVMNGFSTTLFRSQLTHIGSATLTATVGTHADKAFRDIYGCVHIDVTVLGTAIDSSHYGSIGTILQVSLGCIGRS